MTLMVTCGSDMTTTALTITSISRASGADNEPRVLDTDLAQQLGMATPANIRKDLIAPNREELEAFGLLGSRPINTGGRGRPGTAYYLNKDQALLICILSRTEKAKQVRAEVIRRFHAYEELEAFGILSAAQINTGGRGRPTNIRTQIIATNREELEAFGPLHAARAMVAIGSGAKRETTAYYLNKDQALLICILSRTEKAKQVRAEVIRTNVIEPNREELEAFGGLHSAHSPHAGASRGAKSSPPTTSTRIR